MLRLLLFLLLLIPSGARAAGVSSLAACGSAVFAEIGRTGKWSGKPPKGCPSQVSVQEAGSAVAVTVWGVQPGGLGWVETSFTAQVDYAEMADQGRLAAARQDVMARARRMERCLASLTSSHDPGECRLQGSRDYLADEESGVEDRETLWLPDGGRRCVVEYLTGDASATPTPPPSVDQGEPLPPGVVLDIHQKDRSRRRR